MEKTDEFDEDSEAGDQIKMKISDGDEASTNNSSSHTHLKYDSTKLREES